MKSIYYNKKYSTSKHSLPITIIYALLLIILFPSCKDFVQVEVPETDIFSETVFKDDGTATAAIMDIYSTLTDDSFADGDAWGSISFMQALSSDELTLLSMNNPESVALYFNNVTPLNSKISTLWGESYNLIYRANAIIEGIAASTGLSAETKAQLEGEAKFIRAFCHFYLVNLFGDVPYISTTDYRINTVVSRTPVAEVYSSIINDCLDAKNLLTDDYPTSGRVRPNKGTAIALLSRAYLYAEDWANAEVQATEIINKAMYELTDLDQVFLISSTEAIWQLFPSEGRNNGKEGQTFIITETPPGLVLSDELLNAFEEADTRKSHWVDTIMDGQDIYYFAYKYKSKQSDPASEYSTIFRLGEQYLIRAEARAQQGKLTEAITDVDMIRQRGELPLIADTNPSISQSDLLLAIEQERRIELFTEWGHRWFDLKRTGRADAVLSVIKAGWESTDALMPIPEKEIFRNQNLTQNPGY